MRFLHTQLYPLLLSLCPLFPALATAQEAASDSPFQAVVSNVEELTQALRDAAQSTSDRYYIFLRNGEYDFGTTAKTAVPQRTSLIGESQAGVILFNTPSASVKDYQNQTPVLFIDQNQNDVYMQDLTIRANRDWPSRTSQGQAIALRQRGKMAIYKNVTLQGVQDTYYLNKADASAYFEDCTLAGEVDFIYGDGTMLFQHCTLQPVSSKAYITAPNTQTGYQGIVFSNCTIEAEPGAKDAVQGYRLGRPWGDSPASTYLNTTMRVLPSDAGWGSMTSNLVVRFHEYGSLDAQGNLLDLSQRSIAACNPAAGSDSPVLTADEAAQYTLENIFKRVAKDWTPDQLAAQLDAPTPYINEEQTLLTWPQVEGAYCYAICRNGEVIDFTTQTSYPLTSAEGQYTLRVANQRGGLGQPSPVAKPLVAERQLAFPGADGYGKYVTGGRGGEVCYVTSLEDCTDNDLVEGTLRWAIRHNNGGRPRTILFATAGTIYLKSKLKLQYPNVSILGQSAPGGGITITGYNMYICKNNVIVRHLRFRAGDIPNTSMTGLDLENADRVIIDHCSMTWSMEECLTAYDTDSTTIQWCIIGEGLYSSKNAKGSRAYATQWGGEHSTMHHTLITNSHSRAPRFNGVRAPSGNKGEHDYQVDSEFANNVVFNWSGSGNQYGGEYDKAKVEVNYWTKNDPGYNRVYLMYNYYRPGPATKLNCGSRRYWCDPSTPYGQWYLEGNEFEVDGTYCPSTTVWSPTELAKLHADNYYGAESGSNSRGIDLTGNDFTKYTLSALPYSLSGLTYEPAQVAYQQVVTQAGASCPRYDEVDARLLAEAAGTQAPQYHGATIPNELGIIDSPDDVTLVHPDTYEVDGQTYHNMPAMLLEGDRFAIDSDGDGLPDLYEEQQGLNMLLPTDGAEVAANGYTHLENYLNGIADGTIDKTQYETSDVMVIPGQNAGIKTVTNDRPLQYYNIFGQRIAHPAPNQLFIKR